MKNYTIRSKRIAAAKRITAMRITTKRIIAMGAFLLLNAFANSHAAAQAEPTDTSATYAAAQIESKETAADLYAAAQPKKTPWIEENHNGEILIQVVEANCISVAQEILTPGALCTNKLGKQVAIRVAIDHAIYNHNTDMLKLLLNANPTIRLHSEQYLLNRACEQLKASFSVISMYRSHNLADNECCMRAWDNHRNNISIIELLLTAGFRLDRLTLNTFLEQGIMDLPTILSLINASTSNAEYNPQDHNKALIAQALEDNDHLYAQYHPLFETIKNELLISIPIKPLVEIINDYCGYHLLYQKRVVAPQLPAQKDHQTEPKKQKQPDKTVATSNSPKKNKQAKPKTKHISSKPWVNPNPWRY